MPTDKATAFAARTATDRHESPTDALRRRPRPPDSGPRRGPSRAPDRRTGGLGQPPRPSGQRPPRRVLPSPICPKGHPIAGGFERSWRCPQVHPHLWMAGACKENVAGERQRRAVDGGVPAPERAGVGCRVAVDLPGRSRPRRRAGRAAPRRSERNRSGSNHHPLPALGPGRAPRRRLRPGGAGTPHQPRGAHRRRP